MEAKDSVDRLYDIVDKHYQAMSSRIHALEMREMQRVSCAPSALLRNQDLSEFTASDDSQQNPEYDIAAAINGATFDFWEELEQSRVYRKVSAVRASTFSTDQCTMTWSCLSGFSLAELSNISVINLVISTEEVYNLHRISQSWSDDQVESPWPLRPPLELETSVTTTAKHDIQPIGRTLSTRDDSDTSSVETVIKGTQQMESLGTALTTNLETLSDASEDPVSLNLDMESLQSRPYRRGQADEARFYDSPKSAKELDDIEHICKRCSKVCMLCRCDPSQPCWLRTMAQY